MIAAGANATLAVLLFFAASLVAYRLDFTNVWVAFALPWLMILGYSTIDISAYSRPVSSQTVLVVVLVLAVGWTLLPTRGVAPPSMPLPATQVNDRRFLLLLTCYLLFCVLNILLAGYIPLVQGILTGDTGYLSFGVPGIYGLFNAFANALGLTAFYLWMRNPARLLYPVTFFLVLGVFVLFVTRQNLISLVVEAFAVYCMVVRKVSGVRVFLFALGLLLAFGTLGNFRTGSDIADLAAIRHQYLWVPSAFVWLFAYCYFCILNLDNVVAATLQPAFDGSSLASLLPSFLRPESVAGVDVVEVSSFATTSFISPLVHDFGIAGTAVVFSVFCVAVHGYVRLRGRDGSFLGDTGYAVLYFCFAFSFFVNFWFYLPVIFQLAFFPIFKRLLFRRASRPGIQ